MRLSYEALEVSPVHSMITEDRWSSPCTSVGNVGPSEPPHWLVPLWERNGLNTLIPLLPAVCHAWKGWRDSEQYLRNTFQKPCIPHMKRRVFSEQYMQLMMVIIRNWIYWMLLLTFFLRWHKVSTTYLRGSDDLHMYMWHQITQHVCGLSSFKQVNTRCRKNSKCCRTHVLVL